MCVVALGSDNDEYSYVQLTNGEKHTVTQTVEDITTMIEREAQSDDMYRNLYADIVKDLGAFCNPAFGGKWGGSLSKNAKKHAESVIESNC